MACALAVAALAGFLQWWALGGSGTPAAIEHAPLPDSPLVLVARPVLPVSATPSAPSPTVAPESTPTPAAAPLPAVGVTAAAVQVADGGALTEAQMIELLREAGAPEEWHADMLAIAWCESRYRPGAIGDGGNSLGLYQLNTMWFGYAGEDIDQWADPAVNTRTALAVARYDLSRGQPLWTQWSCRSALGR